MNWTPHQSDMRATACIVVAALGYFVDVFDIALFSVLRVPSLRALGLPESEITSAGVYLYNMQLFGMLLGGILWGILGDKRGRIQVLFGSILLYSVANIANAYVENVFQYGIARLFAGIGLAGEIGAGITLVSEVMSPARRGYGTAIVATVGVAGAGFAGVLSEYVSWQNAYIVGGGCGLVLLLLRIAVHESGIFQSMAQKSVSRGNFFSLFSSRRQIVRYVACILPGMPIYFAVGILMTFSPEIGRALGVAEPISVGKAIIYFTIGMCAGDLGSGILSQVVKSRKGVILTFLLGNCAISTYLLTSSGLTAHEYYLLCIPIGVSIGYWAVFISTVAEQYGTNIRATVTTTAPNFIRGAAIPMTWLFGYLKGYVDALTSAQIVGAVTMFIALVTFRSIKETFGRDLDFVEHDTSESVVLKKAA